MAWLSWLSYCIVFQVKKRNNELTDYQICCFLFVFFFLTNQKKNAVFEPKIEHFQGLVGCEAKAKTKDLKMCPWAKDVLEDSTSGFDRPEI